MSDFTDFRFKKFEKKDDDVYHHKKFKNVALKKIEDDDDFDRKKFGYTLPINDEIYKHKKFGNISLNRNVDDFYRHKKFGKVSLKIKENDEDRYPNKNITLIEFDLGGTNDFSDYRHKKFGLITKKNVNDNGLTDYDDYRNKKLIQQIEDSRIAVESEIDNSEEEDPAEYENYKHKKFSWSTYHPDNIK